MREREIRVKHRKLDKVYACEEEKLEKYTQAGVYILRDKVEMNYILEKQFSLAQG